ncbi:MAG: hypothetical protein AAGN35_15890 [Bacteroidota bacterium]
MNRVYTAFFSAVILLGMLTGCRKYEEGPGFSLASKDARATNIWQAENVFQDGIDYTVYFTDWSIDMREDGRIVITDKDEMDSTTTQEGFWDLVDDNERLRLLFSVPRVDPDRKFFTITRLTRTEFWFKEFTDSTTWEYRLIPVSSDTTGE